jgi:hypothetical protein
MRFAKGSKRARQAGRKGGQIGGRARTPAKIRSARENGKLAASVLTPRQVRARSANMRRLNARTNRARK